MKKILLILSFLFITVGCTNINEIDYKDNINNVIKENKTNKIYNQYRKGYKYYLPKYMNIKNDIDFNENTYYLYVDVISYYNKTKKTYDNNASYISYNFQNGDNYGYLEVNNIDNDKYLVEIIYNYAKIEVKVNEMDINEAINNSIILLSTIKYDDEIIKNLVEDNNINNKEEKLDIFGKESDKDNFLKVVEEYDNYENNEDIPDYDKIN